MPLTSWELPTVFTKTYVVNNRNPKATDDGPGDESRPFVTIGAAARVLVPGERVLIAAGTYRERVTPPRGGDGPSSMIGYEAMPGADVVVKGSTEVRAERLRPSKHWGFGKAVVYELEIDPAWLRSGYNPFALVNILTDRTWLDIHKPTIERYLLRRGMVFLNGVSVRQVNLPAELADHPEGAFWVEQHGLTLHIRFPNDGPPERFGIEITTEEQVFSPRERGLGYVRVKGIRFEHCGNGYPPAQRGLVSSMRGHHFVIEDCDIGHANAVGLDVGLEDWLCPEELPGDFSKHVVRRCRIHDCGVCGIAGYRARDLLVEDNLIERVGTHDVELMYESAGIKLHRATDSLVRRNVVRNLPHACGIWLDCLNVDCRITENAFTGIHSITGAVHFEGTHAANEVDHNVIADVRPESGCEHEPHGGGVGVYGQGSNDLYIHHNLVALCRYGFYGRPVARRIIGTRGGVCRDLRIEDNAFIGCTETAIELVDDHNVSNRNLFAGLPAGGLRLQQPEERLDLDAWRRWHGLDTDSREAAIEAEADPATLKLELTVPAGVEITAGPFGTLGAGSHELSLDLRHVHGKPSA